jgi:alkylmercury lyase
MSIYYVNMSKPGAIISAKPHALTELVQTGLRCDHPIVWLFLLRTLAKGQPVSSAGIASALKMSSHDVQVALTTFTDIEYDHAGDIVACGLSLLPTPHSFKIGGHDLYTWCALDALMYPVALDQTALVKSHCPVTGVAVRLTVTPTGVRFLSPTGVVVSIVAPVSQVGCCNVRNSFCSQVHFISSSQAAAIWLSKHPDVIILSVEEAWQLGCAIAQRRREGSRAKGV